jgi:hypothetical protein
MTARTASRRAILSGTAALLALGPAAVGGEADAELLRLVARFERSHAAYLDLCCQQAEEEERLGFLDWGSSLRAPIAEAVDEIHVLREAIGAARATTRDGIAGKLRVALLDWGDDPPFCAEQHHVGWSLCRDLAALGA